MKKGGGKAKGAAFERKVAKELSIWWFNNPNILLRNINSGSTSTKRQAKEVPAGDIMQVDTSTSSLFPYSVECKHYADIGFDSWLLGKNQTIYGFWEQAKSDSARVGRSPLLIMKQNNMPTIFMMEKADYPGDLDEDFDKFNLILFKNLVIGRYDNLLKVEINDVFQR